MQQGLRHVAMVMLVQDMGDQVRPEMTASQRLWQPPAQVLSIRRLPVRQAIARVQRRDQNVLDDEVAIALESGAGRNCFDWFDDAFAIDAQFCRLAFLLRTRALGRLTFCHRVVHLSRLFVHAARFEDWPLFLALEDGHFVIEACDQILERMDLFEQAFGKGLKLAHLFL